MRPSRPAQRGILVRGAVNQAFSVQAVAPHVGPGVQILLNLHPVNPVKVFNPIILSSKGIKGGTGSVALR